MKAFKKAITALLAMMMLAALLGGCQGGVFINGGYAGGAQGGAEEDPASMLVGAWEYAQSYQEMTVSSIMEFTEDGRLVLYSAVMGAVYKYGEGTYSVEGNRLFTEFAGESEEEEFYFENGSLVVVNDSTSIEMTPYTGNLEDAVDMGSIMDGFGDGNFGLGDYDFGDYDFGDYDFGDFDFGDFDFGDYDFGDFDFGDYDFGDFDFGDYDFGDFDFDDYEESFGGGEIPVNLVGNWEASANNNGSVSVIRMSFGADGILTSTMTVDGQLQNSNTVFYEVVGDQIVVYQDEYSEGEPAQYSISGNTLSINTDDTTMVFQRVL